MSIPKIVVTAAMKEEAYEDILALRERGWSIPALILLGIETAKNKIVSEERNAKPNNSRRKHKTATTSTKRSI